MSSGDWVWIAEADDLATSKLLSELMTHVTPTTVLAFCDSERVDSDGHRLGGSYQSYNDELPTRVLAGSGAIDGETFLREALAIKNVILNASAVVFRRDALLAAFERASSDLSRFKLVGDWRLYCEMCSQPGVDVVYRAAVHNSHRLHLRSVTARLGLEEHLGEIAAVQATAAGMVSCPPATTQAARAHLVEARAHLERLGRS